MLKIQKTALNVATEANKAVSPVVKFRFLNPLGINRLDAFKTASLVCEAVCISSLFAESRSSDDNVDNAGNSDNVDAVDAA